MPRQKPLIDTDKLDRDRGVQLDAIKSLAVRLQPTVSPDGSKVSVSNLVALMAKLDTLCSPTRPWNWLGLKKWAELTGISPRACSRTLHALKSLGLIEVEDRMVTQTLRRLAVRIRWENVIDSGTPQQDPELLALWGRKRARQGRLFPASMTTPMRSSRPHGSGHHDHMGQVTMTTPTYIHPPNNPPNHPLGEADGREPMADGQRDGRVDGESFQLSAVSNQPGVRHEEPISSRIGAHTTDSRISRTTTRSDVRRVSDRRAENHQFRNDGRTLGACLSQPSGPDSNLGRDADGEGDLLGGQRNSHPVPPQEVGVRQQTSALLAPVEDQRPGPRTSSQEPGLARSGHPPSATSHEPSPMKFTFPTEFDALVHRLVLLGVQSARAICKRSLQVGYTPQQIADILTWYEGERLHDRDCRQFFPYSAGQLACRLRDADGIGVSPELGNWKGGKCGLWTSLAAKTHASPPIVPQNRHQAAPDDIPVAPLVYRTTMTRQEIETALQKQAESSSRPPSTAVQTSLTRYQDGQPLPKTLAYWLIEAGYPVQKDSQ